ncbi:hypothetical protein I7I50_06010 [Histoplasma capsulatum G186AR]|uniref:Uncharacterized protein n=1 Tax=Ajellomyces capsulatus TaxID=5037 RepID=A0A8H8D214_AJECA|nr:hypothetical protein I7I52_08748 [Histoplasma capsulatum]QSS67043.1 hypothetical protein I7I50_06010 [Histoplasma capsulatum G186AR]
MICTASPMALAWNPIPAIPSTSSATVISLPAYLLKSMPVTGFEPLERVANQQTLHRWPRREALQVAKAWCACQTLQDTVFCPGCQSISCAISSEWLVGTLRLVKPSPVIWWFDDGTKHIYHQFSSN